MIRSIVCLTVFLVVIGCALPVHATTTCSYNFKTGTNNSYLSYCVTANGNILGIQTPFGHQMVSVGEGYGLCQETPTIEYHDYATEASGNWGAATLVSKSGSVVKIARTTSDGNWTLTQTITKVPKTSSITVVMALTNNQNVAAVAYLSRFANIDIDNQPTAGSFWAATINSALGWNYRYGGSYDTYRGLQLQNVGNSQFGYTQGFVQAIPSGPNACAFAYNASTSGLVNNDRGGLDPSVIYSYVDAVPAHGTKTATLSYRGM